MWKMKINNLLVAVCAALMLAACTTPKNITYFPDAVNGETFTLPSNKGIILKPADRLSIIVNTKSVELNNMLNMPITSQIIGYPEQTTWNMSQGTSGYTIDPDGNIEYPLIGKVKAAGMTRSELAEHLKQKLNEQHAATDAVVTVEYLNLGFSVMGEVNKPGFYQFESDKVNLLQGLSKAGDMKITGKRKNVKVIRTDGDKQETYIVDLQNQKEAYKVVVDVEYRGTNMVAINYTVSNGYGNTNLEYSSYIYTDDGNLIIDKLRGNQNRLYTNTALSELYYHMDRIEVYDPDGRLMTTWRR